MRAFVGGFRLELRMVRANPGSLIPLFTAPLFTIIFLTIVRNGGRHDLQPDALMAPVLMTMWWFALFQGGNMLTNDRWQAMLENVLTTPASLASVILGRITAFMCLGLVGFFEVWAIGTAVAFAALFVLSRNSYQFTNSASFPFYVLGGVFFPVAILPGWVQPISKGV